jgi:hypothetical protein
MLPLTDSEKNTNVSCVLVRLSWRCRTAPYLSASHSLGAFALIRSITSDLLCLRPPSVPVRTGGGLGELGCWKGKGKKECRSGWRSEGIPSMVVVVVPRAELGVQYSVPRTVVHSYLRVSSFFIFIFFLPFRHSRTTAPPAHSRGARWCDAKTGGPHGKRRAAGGRDSGNVPVLYCGWWWCCSVVVVVVLCASPFGVVAVWPDRTAVCGVHDPLASQPVQPRRRVADRPGEPGGGGFVSRE